MQLGDAVSAIATPIAKVLNLDCIDPETNDLRPESGCAKRKQLMNDFSKAIYEKFFNYDPKNPPVMTYLVTKQYLVKEASSPEDAVAKSVDAPVISMTVNARMTPATTSPASPVPTLQPTQKP